VGRLRAVSEITSLGVRYAETDQLRKRENELKRDRRW